MKFTLQKRQKYVLYSFLSLLLILWLFLGKGPEISLALKVLLVNIFCVVGVIFTQYPGITYKNTFPLVLLPLHLFVGTLFSLYFFPNLSILFRISALIFSAVALYLISLVNNVFVVIEDKDEVIPLYRVAITWGQILIVIVAIPFFAGVFKIPASFLLQNIAIAVSSFMFCLYLLWTMSFDKEVVQVGAGESIMVSFLVAFFVFALSLSVSFLPTESFLRALFTAGSLMFGLSYVMLHYKNRLNITIIFEYVSLLIILLLLVLIFKP